MRSRSLTVLPLLATALALTGCAVAPGPAPGKPAPTLPADSVAYDQLPVMTTRPNVFPGTCAQFEQNAQLRAAFEVQKTQFNGYQNLCSLTRASGPTAFVGALDPSDRVPDPWAGTWGAYSYTLHHFRRTLLQENRYYAVDSLDVNGCTVSVNTGSKQVLEVSIQFNESGGELVGDSVDADRRIAAKSCPETERLAEVYLEIVDPGGGSLAR
ncbi:hypothetical protein AB0F91_41185 [Amycolatopsis sp. NPDC023774]|uniref:hypothetical protein n=1 Tax=Amycolatopsis sp. NPDC023774 TaxID=3155015 RepID=UPI0033F89621